MSNYWLDLIKREEIIKKLNKDREKREFESLFREYTIREKIKAIRNSQRKQNKI